MSDKWCIYALPIEHGPAINRLFNVINNDGPGDNVSVPMSATGEEPATHIMMSRPLTDAQAAGYPYSKSASWSLPSPYTWPLDGGVTAQDVADAAESARVVTLADNEDPDTLPLRTLAILEGDPVAPLKRIIPPEL